MGHVSREMSYRPDGAFVASSSATLPRKGVLVTLGKLTTTGHGDSAREDLEHMRRIRVLTNRRIWYESISQYAHQPCFLAVAKVWQFDSIRVSLAGHNSPRKDAREVPQSGITLASCFENA